MKTKEFQISNARLNSQCISDTKFKTPREIVSWMGAMQAQDYIMAKWAVGMGFSFPSLLLMAGFQGCGSAPFKKTN